MSGAQSSTVDAQAVDEVRITEPGVCDLDEATEVPVGPDHCALVDRADRVLVGRYEWRLLRGHNGKLYAWASVSRKSIYMHRLILGTPAGLETDHRNGDGLDNRRSNLRTATASQNRANMGKPRRPDGGTHTSRYKGVSWDRSRGKWQAKIHSGRHINLGRYEAEAEAARAYDAAAVRQWGEYAQLNFPAVAS